MNDSTNDRPPDARDAPPDAAPQETYPEMLVRVDREVSDCADRFFEALKAYTEAIRQQSWARGWDKGFNMGWEGAFKSVKRQMEERTEQQVRPPAPVMPEAPSSHISTSVVPTSNELVLEYITDHPGKRGFEIAHRFSSALLRLPERTVRTALHRLKAAKKIKIVEGRWYATEAAPASPQQAQLLQEDD